MKTKKNIKKYNIFRNTKRKIGGDPKVNSFTEDELPILKKYFPNKHRLKDIFYDSDSYNTLMEVTPEFNMHQLIILFNKTNKLVEVKYKQFEHFGRKLGRKIVDKTQDRYNNLIKMIEYLMYLYEIMALIAKLNNRELKVYISEINAKLSFNENFNINQLIFDPDGISQNNKSSGIKIIFTDIGIKINDICSKINDICSKINEKNILYDKSYSLNHTKDTLFTGDHFKENLNTAFKQYRRNISNENNQSTITKTVMSFNNYKKEPGEIHEINLKPLNLSSNTAINIEMLSLPQLEFEKKFLINDISNKEKLELLNKLYPYCFLIHSLYFLKKYLRTRNTYENFYNNVRYIEKLITDLNLEESQAGGMKKTKLKHKKIIKNKTSRTTRKLKIKN
jgi:hypothetical protein